MGINLRKIKVIMFSLQLIVGLLVSTAFAIEADIGYGVKLAGTEDASPCQIQVNVPEKFAGDDCQLEVFLDTVSGRDYKVYIKEKAELIAGNFTFTSDDEAEKVPNVSDTRDQSACPNAGLYVIELQADSNAVSDLFGNDAINVAVLKGNNYVLYPKRGYNSYKFLLSEERWVFFYFTLDGPSVPHFDIDLGATSKLDNLDYYFTRTHEIDISKDMENRQEVEGDKTLDVQLTQNGQNLDAGDYTFGIYVRSTIGGATTRFRVAFELNREVGDETAWPEHSCPTDVCENADKQSCQPCTESSCNWCASEEKCTHYECPTSIVTVNPKDCEDLDARCLEYADCAACASDKWCVWCDRTVGSDVCTSGENQIGKTCPHYFTDSLSEPGQCEGFVSCADNNECGECILQDGCSWDVEASECKRDETVSNVPGIITETHECPEAPEKCQQSSNCVTCTGLHQKYGCIWCDSISGKDRCLAGKLGETCEADERSRIVCDDCPEADFDQCAAQSSAVGVVLSFASLFVAGLFTL